jgi:hypothetical protein
VSTEKESCFTAGLSRIQGPSLCRAELVSSSRSP